MANTIATVFNPLTGVFGSGNVQFFPGNATTQTYTWTVPAGVDAVRVRVWGAGGYNNGCGGGFAMKSIYGISGTTSISITVGTGGSSGGGAQNGGTSSFGSFVSATGGVANSNVTTNVGVGVGGDVNYSGGLGANGGGGAAGLLGNGGHSVNASVGSNGCSGGGVGNSGTAGGGNGFMGAGGLLISSTSYWASTPTTGLETDFSIDFIGTGGGGALNQSGVNGGGGGGATPSADTVCHGGYPGGGMGAFTTSTLGRGGSGLVIVEW